MLDNFRNEQPIVYKMLINSIKNNKLSHAYLFDSNGYDNAFDFVLSFAKSLLCPFNYTNNSCCGDCTQCTNIDISDFPELKIIEADGQWIKKDQLDSLQYDFSKKALIGAKRVYIIKNAEKLNISSSNSLLKFLEEPQDGVIAILLTSNLYQLMSTIISRCQLFSFINVKTSDSESLENKIGSILFDDSKKIDEYVLDDKTTENINNVVKFILFFEQNKSNTIIYINKYWNDFFKEREENFNALTIMMLFYKDVLNYKLFNKIKLFNNYENEIIEISKKNEIDSLMRKINVIIDMQGKIKFNMNSSLLMDKLIIELERSERI